MPTINSSFRSNYSAWARRLGEERTEEDLGRGLAAVKALGLDPESRQTAITAVVGMKVRRAQWSENSLDRFNIAKAIAWYLYQGAYYPDASVSGKTPFQAIASKLNDADKVLVLVSHMTKINEVCIEGVLSRSREHNTPSVGNMIANLVTNKARQRMW